MKISLKDQISEVRYELGMRAQVYPNLQGGVQKKRERTQHVLCMEAVLAKLLWLQEHEIKIEAALREDVT